MNHAFLIQVHAYPQLLLKIIERLNAPNHYFFIHIDKKSKSIFHSSIIEAIKLTDNVTVISDYKVNWGGEESVRCNNQSNAFSTFSPCENGLFSFNIRSRFSFEKQSSI